MRTEFILTACRISFWLHFYDCLIIAKWTKSSSDTFSSARFITVLSFDFDEIWYEHYRHQYVWFFFVDFSISIFLSKYSLFALSDLDLAHLLRLSVMHVLLPFYPIIRLYTIWYVHYRHQYAWTFLCFSISFFFSKKYSFFELSYLVKLRTYRHLQFDTIYFRSISLILICSTSEYLLCFCLVYTWKFCTISIALKFNIGRISAISWHNFKRYDKFRLWSKVIVLWNRWYLSLAQVLLN